MGWVDPPPLCMWPQELPYPRLPFEWSYIGYRATALVNIYGRIG